MRNEQSANVARFLEKRASEQPDKDAVLSPCGRKNGRILYERTSYSELHAQSEQIAHAMAAAGITAGTRTLLMVRPGSDLIRCCFALFKIGAVPVVIDPGMGMRNFLSCVTRTLPEAFVGIPMALWIARLFPRAFQSVRTRVKVGRSFGDWYGTFPRGNFPISEPSADDLAAILFTSGSTGPPKGVRYGHGQFDAQVRLVRETFSIEEGEVDMPMLPVFALFNPALGMTTVVPEMNPGKPAQADPEKILQAIEQCRVTNSFGSPVLWKKISRYANRNGRSFPAVRRILMAGAPVPPQLVKDLQPCFPNAIAWSPYGATECLPVCCIDGGRILETSAGKTVSGAGTCVGLPVSGVRIRIIQIVDHPIQDIADCKFLEPGEIGEVIATGPSVTRGYDHLPEATKRAKISDGDTVWHRMGDAGYIDSKGNLWFCGRIAERIVTAGGPMYTDCCEGIFNSIPGVNRSALIGLGTSPNQEPAIVIETEHGASVPEKLVVETASRFDPTKNINKVFFSKAFPVDVRHNAKIHRLELARKFNTK